VPNGHGGIPRFGGPIFYAVLAALALAFKLPAAAAAALAAIAGWRLAYHLHFWRADEYSGAYTDPDQYRRARLRYWCLGALYALGAAAAIFLFT
jgi:hypothetical protein